MIRFVFWLVFCIAFATPSFAQRPPPVPPVPPVIEISPGQARAALDMLNDPAKRAAFTSTLEAIVKGSPISMPAEAAAAPETKTTVEGISLPLAPDSLGAQVLLSASSLVNAIGDEAVKALRAVQSLPLLWGWIVVMVTNPLGQHLLTESAWRLTVALILSGTAAFVLRYFARSPMRRVLAQGRGRLTASDEVLDPEARAELGETETPPHRDEASGFLTRFWRGLGRFALETIPAVGLLVAGHIAAASSLGGQTINRLVILAVIDAIAACLALLALKTMLFMPDPPGLKLFPFRHAVGSYLMRWGRRLILIAVPGYTIGEVGLLLGLSNPAHAAWQHGVGTVLRICFAIMILQRRHRVSAWLSAPAGATGAFARIRDRTARYWHWLALFILSASWLAWVFQAADAMLVSLWYWVLAGGIILIAGMARMAVNSIVDRIQYAPVDASEYSVLARLSSYRKPFRFFVHIIINLIAVLTLLQLFGFGGLRWMLTSDVGHRVMSGMATLTVTIGVAFAIWEGVNIAIQRHLETLRQEAQGVRSARLRTLLPLVRTSLFITIVVVCGLMVLSEIGVNIAPLLAGAGIVGVAIGFGSQKLVQDVITGVFLLLENTMQVGDVVRVGDQSGLVESLSVRTIRLRTEDGSVVVIPFSAVTTVVNMTRDFSRAVVAVNIGVAEDVDKVLDVLRGIAAEMRGEEAWSSVILDDLEVWGLDKFNDSSLLIKCRILCTPFGRWPVGREFNRRMKVQFEEKGIAIGTSPSMTLVLPDPMPPAFGARPAKISMPDA